MAEAYRYRNAARAGTAGDRLHGRRVRAAVRQHLGLIRDVLLLCKLVQREDELLIAHNGVVLDFYRRAVAELDAEIRSCADNVARGRYVNGYAYIGAYVEGSCARAAAADLLLH